MDAPQSSFWAAYRRPTGERHSEVPYSLHKLEQASLAILYEPGTASNCKKEMNSLANTPALVLAVSLFTNTST